MGSEDAKYVGVYFSPLNTTLYPEAWKHDGTYSEEAWPADAILLNDNEIDSYWKQSPPAGKTIGTSNGRPSWVDLPAPSLEEMISQAESQKNSLMYQATTAIAPLQDAVDLDMATDDEKALLAAWKKYRVLLNRIDITKVPALTWPTSP